MVRQGNPRIFTDNDTESNDKNYVTKPQADILYMNTNEPYSSHLDMSGNKIINVGNPAESSDAVNKTYLDQELNKVCFNIAYTNNYIEQIVQRLDNMIPSVGLRMFSFAGSRNIQVSHHTVVRQIIDENFRNVKRENIWLHTFWDSQDNQVSLNGKSSITELSGNTATIKIFTENSRNNPWSSAYDIYVRYLMIPKVSEVPAGNAFNTSDEDNANHEIDVAEAPDQQVVYALSDKTLRELYS